MNPLEYRTCTAANALSATIVPTSLGSMLVTATDSGLWTLEFGADEQSLHHRFLDSLPSAQGNASARLNAWTDSIVAHLERPSDELNVPLDVHGSAFQCRVWDELQKIPSGTTVTYSEVAERIGRPTAARAVARACATNRLAIVIPCHRVIRSDGGLSGYRWGIERKKALLEKEVQCRPIEYAEATLDTLVSAGSS